MAETKTVASQVQQAVPGMEYWKKAVEDQGARLGQLYDEAAKAHAKWIEFGNNQLDEMTEFAKTGFNYVNELAADFRKLSLENSKKAMDFYAR
ncbi:MAG: hypothetical protein IT380_27565 [Myxococcales bacterium]|nr:hypothetical protein [Myxococcales bacterium]